mgnify:CR=1 FL=1
MRPGALGGKVITQRRGFRKYNVSIEGRAVRAEHKKTEADAMTWFLGKSAEIIALSRPAKRLTVAVQDVRADHYSALMPHRLEVVVTMSFLYQNMADAADAALRKIFTPDVKKKGPRARIELLEERPPLRAKKANPVVARLAAIGEEWKLPFDTDSSAAPSAAGLVSGKIPVVCGLAPAGRNILTPLEAVKRGEVLPRALLLALYLDGGGNNS